MGTDLKTGPIPETPGANPPPDPAQAGLFCLNCVKSRFPNPQEQCYKFGGLICTVDDSNVEKYQTCKFPVGVGSPRTFAPP